jgi:hypothetical protein
MKGKESGEKWVKLAGKARSKYKACDNMLKMQAGSLHHR